MPYVATPASHRVGFLGVALVTASCLVLGILVANPWSQGQRAAVATTMALTTLIPFVIPIASGRRMNLGEPIYAVSVLYFLLFPLRTFYLLANPEAHQTFSARPYESFLDRALLLALLGYLLILVGYYSPLGRQLFPLLPVPRRDFMRSSTLPRAGAVFAVGFVTQLFIILEIGRTFTTAADEFTYTGGENVLIQLGLFYLYGLAIATMVAGTELRRRRPWAVVIVLGMLAGAAVISVLFVFKSAVVLAVAAVALAYHFRYRPITLRAAAVAAGLILLLIFPLIGTQRTLVHEGSVKVTDDVVQRLQEGVRDSFSDLIRDGPASYLDRSWDSLMSRSNGIDSLATIVGYTPAVHPYQHGTHYALLPAIAYVPRAAWPDKPVRFADEFDRLYLGRPGETNFGITNLGDLYMNFGISGVLAGAFLLGVLYRFVYSFLIERTGASDVGVFVYIFVLLQLLLAVESEIVPGLAQVLKLIPILALISLFLTVRGQPKLRAPASSGITVMRGGESR